MSTVIPAPRVHELDLADIRSILTRNHVGRLAFSWNGSIDIRPIHYVYSGDRIYGRTSYGGKFERMHRSLPAPVAFEVDEITSLSQWRSVIVHGDFSVVVPNAAGRNDWVHAVAMLRRVSRNTFTPEDPFPQRDLIFAIAIRDMTGRVMR